MLIDNHILEDKYFFRLAAIFKEKGWAIDKSTDDEYSIFDLCQQYSMTLCAML